MWSADLATAPWETDDQATYAGAVSFRILCEARFIMKQLMTIFYRLAQIMAGSLESCALWRVFGVKVAHGKICGTPYLASTSPLLSTSKRPQALQVAYLKRISHSTRENGGEPHF